MTATAIEIVVAAVVAFFASLAIAIIWCAVRESQRAEERENKK